MGRVLTEESGVIHGSRLQLARGNQTTVWLLKMQSGRGIDLKFQNVRLPRGEHSPFLIVKAGLLGTYVIIMFILQCCSDCAPFRIELYPRGSLNTYIMHYVT